MKIVKNFYFAMALMLAGFYMSVNGQSGSGNQPLELQYGTTDVVYPIRIEKPQGKECGGGILDKLFPDHVLVYKTPGGGRSHADNIKFWSTDEKVRNAINKAYGGKLHASGLTTPTTRVCIGARATVFSGYRNIYLWRRRPIAGRQ